MTLAGANACAGPHEVSQNDRAPKLIGKAKAMFFRQNGALPPKHFSRSSLGIISLKLRWALSFVCRCELSTSRNYSPNPHPYKLTLGWHVPILVAS